MEDIPLSALFGALAVLLVVSAFFSISETSMMALNRYRLKVLVKQGTPGARQASELLSKTDKLLGVVLLGNNLVNAAAALVVGEITIRLLGDSEWALVVASGMVTFAILVFSEITPKVLAASYPERIALPLSYLLGPLLKIFYPIVWFVNLFVRGFLRVLRLTPEHSAAPKLTLEELRALVLEESHFIPKKHQSVLVNLLDLEAVTVDDVMIPRSRIDAIDLDAPDEALRSQLYTSYHTRVLAYRGKLDDVAGIIHVRRVLNLIGSEEITGESLQRTLSEPYFVPAGTPLFTQLQHFQEGQRRLGLVVDEYGELMGLVTLEDILEEVIGEFTTHAPSQPGTVARQEDGSVLVEGTASLRDLNRKLGLRLPLDGPKTINGLILEHFEDIPESGTSVLIAEHPMEIVQTQDRVVKVVRIFPARGERGQA